RRDRRAPESPARRPRRARPGRSRHSPAKSSGKPGGLTMFRFEVATEVFERFPDYVVACVLARGIDSANAKAAVQQLLSDATARSRISYEGVDLKSLPQFAAWRDAFSRAGWSASRFPASVEALHRRVQRGSDPPSINPAVDLSNSAVLFYS